MTSHRWLAVTALALAFGFGLGRSGEIAPAAFNALAQTAKVPLPAGCERPAYLVVSIDDLDRSKSAPYGEALRRTQIVPRHGGEYVAVGSSPLVLEGTWPAGRSMVVERYPCLEMIKAFWYSDEYQKEIMPLRAGSGTYTVVAFEAFVPQQR